MLETNVVKAFFSLLKAGLWGSPLELSAMKLRDKDWQALYNLAVQHTVETLLWDAVEQLPKDSAPPQSLAINWLVRTEKIAQRNRWVNRKVAAQFDLFEGAGLTPFLLKGQGLAQYYINPLRRLSGDVDWCFESKGDFKAAVSLLESKGITVEVTAGFSASYMDDSCEVDLHQRFFDVHNPFLQGYLKRMRQEQAEAQVILDGQAVRTLGALAQSLQVNAHILKHLLSFGIGLRQLCDAARLYYYYKGGWDAMQVKRLYQDLKMLKWVDELHYLLVQFLGLKEEYLPFPLQNTKYGDWMMLDILRAGNFGFHDARYKAEEEAGVRSQSKRRIMENARRYWPYAPMEALSFPITQLYSRFTK